MERTKQFVVSRKRLLHLDFALGEDWKWIDHCRISRTDSEVKTLRGSRSLRYNDLSDISGVLKSSHWSQRSMFAKVIPEILTERKFQITAVAPSSTAR